jgi:hypothetical protein
VARGKGRHGRHYGGDGYRAAWQETKAVILASWELTGQGPKEKELVAEAACGGDANWSYAARKAIKPAASDD